jgi:hypothetical protein
MYEWVHKVIIDRTQPEIPDFALQPPNGSSRTAGEQTPISWKKWRK